MNYVFCITPGLREVTADIKTFCAELACMPCSVLASFTALRVQLNLERALCNILSQLPQNLCL